MNHSNEKQPIGAIYVFIMEDGSVDVQSVYEPEQTQKILQIVADSEVSHVREIELEEVQEDYQEGNE